MNVCGSVEVRPVKINRSLGVAACLLGLLGLRSPIAAEEAAFTPAQIEYFEKQVRPLLVEHCQKCHGAEKQKGELRLDSREALLKGGETGPGIVAGKPAESELIKALKYDPDGYQMPPDGKLPDETVAVFVKWVEMGAPWPAMAPTGRDRLAPTGAEEFQRRSQRYAFQPLKRVTPPTVKQTSWPRTPIDRFVLSQLEAAGQSPAAEADKRTWIRRVYLDTLGLPPTPEVVAAFLADESPDAHERVVDELLASPRFGERWGRHWLDLVRYAESRGHEFDYDVPNPWHYRDYVIQAINGDLPYDEFVVEHVAGDLVEQGLEASGKRLEKEGRRAADSVTHLLPLTSRLSQSAHPSVATGFWYLGEWVHSPVDIRKDETDRVDNMLDVFGKTFLGLTLGCARCHDHKFDPISQKDYYALAGYIQSTSYAQRPFEVLDHNRRIQAQLRELDKRAAEPILRAYQTAAAPELEKVNHYLLATRELLARAGESNDPQVTQLLEDFESGSYDGWVTTGDAFGSGPQSQKTIGSYQGNVQAHGEWFINSHQLRDSGKGDDHVGTLTSREFEIQHDTLRFLIGGGNHPGQTGIQLMVDGQAVLSATGHNSNQMRAESWDLRPFRGKRARLQIIDQVRGGWGNIGIDHLVFRNQAATLPNSPEVTALAERLAQASGLKSTTLLAWARHAVAAAENPADRFHQWARFAVGRASTLDAAAPRAAVDLSQAIAIPVLTQDGVYYALPDEKPATRIWLSSNAEAPIARIEASPTATVVDPDFASFHEREGSMRDVGALTSLVRAGRTLATARFTIQKPKVGAWVRGGCATYVVVDSHAIVLGPLHGSIVRSHEEKPDWHWIEHDLSRYVGHQAHVEIIAKPGQTFGVDGVFQLDAIPGPLASQASNVLNVDAGQDLPLDTLDWARQHPDLFGLDTSEFRQKLAEVAKPFVEQRQALVSQIRSESAVAPVMLEGSAANEQILIRGNSNKPNGVVPRRFIEVFHGQGPDETEPGSGRLDLARQLIDPQQTPVLSRVIVNRIWHHYFGRGIVSSVDDFGHMGELPSNPELLDWLATELIREDWSLKQIHRVVLLSAAYREGLGARAQGLGPDTERHPANDEGLMTKDSPLPRIPRRLEGEIIRDSLLALSGRLDDRLYGQSVPIALNPFQDGRGRPASGPIDGAGRRSLYLSVRRNFADSFLTAFDLPNAHTTMGRRSVSNVPAQALALLNSPMVLEQTKLWGARLCRDTEGLSPTARVDRLYEEAFSRKPTDEERVWAIEFLRDSAAETKIPESDPRAWADLCHVLINTKEFFYVR
jgi:cytochrome c553